MKFPGRRAARIAFSGCSLIVLAITASPAPVPAAKPTGESPAAFMTGEPRLRKLHLVRPDLIPYPIAYEVYC